MTTGEVGWTGYQPKLVEKTGRTHCEACGESISPDVYHQCPTKEAPPEGTLAFMNSVEEMERPSWIDECQEILTYKNGAKLWLGNKIAAGRFIGKGEILCVIEVPHCLAMEGSHHIHILEDGEAKVAKLDEAAAKISELLDTGKDVLVHCSAGMERSPLTVAWWMIKEGVIPNFDEAYRGLMLIRPCVQDRRHWVEKDRLSEQEKYEKMWGEVDNYRVVAPGEATVPIFLQNAKPKPDSTVIDFGAGTGRGALLLAILGGVKVKMLDFASNCLDEDVRNALVTQSHVLDFTQHDLMNKVPFTAEYGYCTDVMEHIPPDDVPLVLSNILHAAQHVFFQISCQDDVMGGAIGEHLHLTVKPYAWWLKLLQSFDAQIHWSKDFGTHCCFYVTAWVVGKDLTDAGILNLSEQKCIENVKINLARELDQVIPHSPSDVEVVILGGSPTLGDHLDEIRNLRAAGAKIVTLNGAYNWALENDLAPVTQIIVDARPHNIRFVEPVREDCLYLIASQCDPGVFDRLPRHKTLIWHTTAEMFKDQLDAAYDNWYGIFGGSTVLLRAIPLLRMLGFSKFHMFGCDSCLVDAKHHLYSQPENDKDLPIPINLGGRTFQCHAWMASQANEFMDLITVFGDEVQLEIYGDGLLSHILKTGAKINDEELMPLP